MSVRMLAVTIVSVGAFLALAAWPYGGIGPFLANPARLAVVVLMIAGSVAALFTHSSGMGSGVREDRGNRWILIPVTILSIGSAFVPAWSDAHGVWVVDGDAVRYTGLVIGAAGMTLRLLPVFVLEKRFSGLVAIQPEHTLQTDGVYRTIRHPSYLGLLITLIGWSLVFRSLLGLLLVVAMLWPLVGRMNAEEKLLAEHFGEEYESYRKRTWRLIPYLY